MKEFLSSKRSHDGAFVTLGPGLHVGTSTRKQTPAPLGTSRQQEIKYAETNVGPKRRGIDERCEGLNEHINEQQLDGDEWAARLWRGRTQPG